MDENDRALINHAVSRLFGLHRKSPLTDSEINKWQEQASKSEVLREKLRQLSEVSLDELDPESREWLSECLNQPPS